MDCNRNFLKEFKCRLDCIDEGYLIGISNKGTYNRALKDLGKNPDVKVSIGDTAVSCEFADGNTCTLVADIKQWKCTCPSKSICKHVIMGLVYLRQNGAACFGEITGAAPEEDAGGQRPDFSALLAIEPGELKKLVGEKNYQDILFRLEFGIETEIEEGLMLTVKFKEEGITVKFPAVNTLEDAICSCKSRDFCKHRAEAILYYRMAKGKLTAADLPEEKSMVIPEDVLEIVSNFVAELLVSGLSRLPATSMDGMEQMALICRNAGLANLEKLFRRLKNEAELYFKKDATFTRDSLRNVLLKIYGLCLAMRQGEKPPGFLAGMAGEQRSHYYEIPAIEFSGMGAQGWISRAGFEGITCYFYYIKQEKWFTYTIARPTYYDDARVDLSGMYKAAPPWGLEGELGEFSKAKIKLWQGKMNGEGRLSASEESSGRIIGGTNIQEFGGKDVICDNWTHVLQKIKEGFDFTLVGREENFNLLVLKIAKWGQGSFDHINQLFTLPLYDGEENVIRIALSYTGVNKYLIRKLESIEKSKTYPELLLGKVYPEAGELKISPIAAYYDHGSIINLTLD